MTDSIKNAKESVALVGELIKAAGNDPAVKEAAGNLGQTAVTLTKLINNALLPLAAINFAFEKARAYFRERFEQDFSAKAARIPAAHMIEPKASIAGPALQGIAFAHEEPNLKDMYLSLLANAMDDRSAPDAHPGFVETIKQLTAEEASILAGPLRAPGAIPTAEVRVVTSGEEGWVSVAKNLLHLTDPSGNPVENTRMAAMVDNWVRLGLVEVDYNTHLTGEHSYAWIESRPEFVRCRAQHAGEGKRVIFQKGIVRRTALGCQFALSVGLIEGA